MRGIVPSRQQPGLQEALSVFRALEGISINGGQRPNGQEPVRVLGKGRPCAELRL